MEGKHSIFPQSFLFERKMHVKCDKLITFHLEQNARNSISFRGLFFFVELSNENDFLSFPIEIDFFRLLFNFVGHVGWNSIALGVVRYHQMT